MPPTPARLYPLAVLAILAVGTASQRTAAQGPAEVEPGATVTLQVPVSAGDLPGVTVHYRIRFFPGVYTSPAGEVEGTAGGHALVAVPVRVTIPASQTPGVRQVGTVQRSWGPGASDSFPLLVRVVGREGAAVATGVSAPAATPPPVRTPRASPAAQVEGQEGASTQIGGLTKEVEVELYGSTRAAHPGGIVLLRFTLNSYEDTDERLRLRVEAPEGWTVLDRDVEAREFVLEAWESIEGEVRVVVPPHTRAGTAHRVRMVAHVAGEPGGAAVLWSVQVVRRGALRPGAVGLTGTAAVAASNLQADGLESSRVGAIVALTGPLSRHTTLSLNYRQGPRENVLTNFRIPQEEMRWSGSVRGRDWNLEFGNQIGSGGGAVAGPYVRGQGVTVRRTEGLFAGHLTAVQPTSYVGEAAGTLVRGAFGIGGRAGRFSLAFSDFNRPVGGYSTQPLYPEDIDPDSLERLEREREALAQGSSNRVRAAGGELELRPGAHHRLVMRGGTLHLSNADGDTVQEPAAEAYYTFSHRVASLNVGWRTMPSSLNGIMLAGDQASVDASLKVIGDLRLAGRGYRTLTETVGDGFRSESEGASLGVRYYRQRWRFEARGNSREWSYGASPTVAHTGSLSFGAPLGPINLSGYLEQGTQRRDTLSSPSASYRGDLRWQGRAGLLSLGGSYYETLTSEPRLRTDLLGSVRLGGWELSGGAWATRGWIVGGEPGFWSLLGIPVSYDLLLTMGVEHAPTTWGARPVWLGTIGIRKNVAIPIPFLRDRSSEPGSLPRETP